MSTELAKAIVAYTNSSNYELITDNDACVRTIFNNAYWSALKIVYPGDDSEDGFGLYLFLGIAVGAVFVIAVLLLVIYFKRRKTDESEETEEGAKKLTEP